MHSLIFILYVVEIYFHFYIKGFSVIFLGKKKKSNFVYVYLKKQ